MASSRLLDRLICAQVCRPGSFEHRQRPVAAEAPMWDTMARPRRAEVDKLWHEKSVVNPGAFEQG